MLQDVGGANGIQVAKLADVLVQLEPSHGGDFIVDFLGRTGHEGENAVRAGFSTSLLREGLQKVDLEIVKVVVGSEEDELLGFRESVGVEGIIRLKDGVDTEPVLVHLVVEGDDLCRKENAVWQGDRGRGTGGGGGHGRGKGGCGGLGVRAVWDGGLAVVDDAERDAVLLVVDHGLFPILDLWEIATVHEGVYIVDGEVGCGVTELDERGWDQAGTAEPADGFGDEPLAVGLGDDRDGIACLGVELVGALCEEIVEDDGVEDARLWCPRGAGWAGLAVGG